MMTSFTAGKRRATAPETPIKILLCCILFSLVASVTACSESPDSPTTSDPGSPDSESPTDSAAPVDSRDAPDTETPTDTSAPPPESDANDTTDTTEPSDEGPAPSDISSPSDVAPADTSEDTGTPPEQDASDSVGPVDTRATPDLPSPDSAAPDMDTGETAPDSAAPPMDTAAPDTDVETETVNPWEVTFEFNDLGVQAGGIPTLTSVMVPLPPGVQTVDAQITIRGDLDNFPAAFFTLVVEQAGQLKQCGDVSGMPQPPNTIQDDIFRVAFPRPSNLLPQSIYYPPAPPWDFQPLPCAEAFLNKSEVEVGIVVAYAYAPGVSGNQGASACGGAGCPNDARVTLRFGPDPAPPSPGCLAGESSVCVCADGQLATQVCEVDGTEFGVCNCPDGGLPPDPPPTGNTLGTCGEPLAFEIGPDNPTLTIPVPGTSFHTVPWPPLEAACPQSKPPFAIEHFFLMNVTAPGQLTLTPVLEPEPWSIIQYFVDIQDSCADPYQCGPSTTPQVGTASEGELIVGVTYAPPQEIYIPDQTNWSLLFTVEWSPLQP